MRFYYFTLRGIKLRVSYGKYNYIQKKAFNQVTTQY